MRRSSSLIILPDAKLKTIASGCSYLQSDTPMILIGSFEEVEHDCACPDKPLSLFTLTDTNHLDQSESDYVLPGKPHLRNSIQSPCPTTSPWLLALTLPPDR